MTPPISDVLYDITFYLNNASAGGGDRAYMTRIVGDVLLVSVTDIDSMESAEYQLTVAAISTVVDGQETNL